MTSSTNERTRMVVGVAVALVALIGSIYALVRVPGSGGADLLRQSEAEQPARRPSDWHWVQRTYPYFDYDTRVVAEALEERLEDLAVLGKHESAWSFAGPLTTGGRVVDIAFDQRRDGVVYLAAATGGVFKSVDDGATWTPVFDDQAMLTIGDIAVDPRNGDTVYVGTGEANGGHNNAPGAGIYRSFDGGTTWSVVGLETTASIGRILVDPADTRRILVAAIGSYFATSPDRGVYLSEDHGSTWTQTLFVNDSTGVIDLALNPRSPDTVFAATWERVRRPSGNVYLHGEGSGVWRSTDAGVTWLQLTSGLPDPDQLRDATGRPRFGRIGLAVSPSNPSIVYALFVDGATNGYLGLYRSNDGGDSWMEADPLKRAGQAFSDFSWYFGQVRVSPDDPETVFVLDKDIALSRDGGASWTVQSGTHVDHHALEYRPSGGTILSGNDGGLARSMDDGASWQRLGELPITQFYEINFDPSDPRLLLGGTQDNGTIRSAAVPGAPWTQILGGDGFYVVVDPDDPARVYAESQNGVLYRIDGSGITSIKPPATQAANWSTPFLLHPDNSSVLLYGGRRVHRSTNRGSTWNVISPTLGKNQTGRLGTITTMAVSPLDSDVIYAGTDDGNVWVSMDDGATWMNRSSGLINRWATRVVPSPHAAGGVYVSFSGLKWRDPEPHIFKSNDFGVTWSPASGDLPDSPVNALLASPADAGLLYAGLDIGAYYSEDDGQTWTLLGTGLPAVSVYDFKYVAESGTLIAGTYGRSIYTLDVNGTPTATEGSPDVRQLEVAAFPNPFKEFVQIRISGHNRHAILVTVCDVLGRIVYRDTSIEVVDGTAQIRWNGETVSGERAAPGAYFIVASTSGSRVGSAAVVRAQ